MSTGRAVALAGLVAAGCATTDSRTVTMSADRPASPIRRDEAPVPVNSDSPVLYPEAMASQELGGTVLLHLFVDSAGTVVKESTSVQESSGYPALDSAAVLGAPRLRYSPALRDNQPVAAHFLQPINFRPSGKRGTTP